MTEADEFSKEGFFSMIEKAVKPQFFLLTLSFALFVDSCLVYFSSMGFKDIVAGASPINAAIAIKIMLIFLAFSGLVSMILPFAQALFIFLYIVTIYRALEAFGRWFDAAIGANNQHSSLTPRETDCVRPGELREAAHLERSDFMLKLYDAFHRREDRKKIDQRKSQFYAFCALFFTALNYWLPGAASDHTVTTWVDLYCSSNTPVVSALLLFAALVLAPLYINGAEERWVYCPPLHLKLEAIDKAQRLKDQEFREEVEREIAKAKWEREHGR
ncbi:hypothetical protein [Pandoraea communis]|uniref:hypothetical protein n=1 Tax=Pandoraea communis TaxID=2508297 RepID=UPI0025A5DCF9|nr:hypothetical protein [Pandoraea communis]MDM8359660.1 hypothetical protein [Pandoraea communis]